MLHLRTPAWVGLHGRTFAKWQQIPISSPALTSLRGSLLTHHSSRITNQSLSQTLSFHQTGFLAVPHTSLAFFQLSPFHLSWFLHLGNISSSPSLQCLLKFSSSFQAQCKCQLLPENFPESNTMGFYLLCLF